MAIISINGNSLDPSAPTLEAFNLVQETAEDSDYILIQTNSPLTKDIKQNLAEKQVEIQEKVSEDTYLCRYTPNVRTTDCGHKLELTSPLGPL
jgi:serine protease AprX